MKTKKCPNCGDKYNPDEFYGDSAVIGKYKGKELCYGCVEQDMEYASTILAFTQGGMIESVKFGRNFIEYNIEDDFTDNTPPEWFNEVIKGSHWHSTDGWRGYEVVDLNEGYTGLANGWVTEYSDSTTQRKMTVAKFFNKLKNRELLPPCPIYVIFSHTSNVFSTCCDFICHKNDMYELEKWMESIAYPVEELNSDLG